MANTLYDAYLNPVKFHSLDPSQLPQYVSRFMDDWAFRRTIQPWEERKCFLQPWNQDDSIRLQYTSNYGPITLEIRDINGLLVHSQVMDTGLQDELRPTYYLRQADIDLASFEPGLYYMQRIAAGITTVSEPFELFESPGSGDIYPDNPNPTVYIEYSHYETYGGIKFQAPFSPAIRVPAWLKFNSPAAKDTVYEDQLLNQTMVRSVPYRLFNFILGGKEGVPPWVIDKVNRIFGCSSLSIDGRLFTKNEGAAFEPNELEGYPMSGWSIEMREKLNRDSIITENDVVIPGIAAAGILIDVKGFGMNDNSGNDYQEIIALI